MRFTGIIFDFNGVLWWDQHLQEKSWNDFAQAFRGRTFSPQEFAIHVHGRNMAYTLAYLAGHALDQEQVGLLGEQKEAIYRQLCLAKGQDFLLSPGAGEKSLRSCTGINSLM
jgi:beta-phosphoglucomutase-like phosphatase (HAD superfamily)